MSRDRVLRVALWISVAVNTIGVVVFAPLILGRPSAMLPVAPSPFLAAQIAWVIALFGGVYFWLARQAAPNRALVIVGGIGKLGFFAISVIAAATAVVPAAVAVNAVPDLLLGGVFLWWAARIRA